MNLSFLGSWLLPMVSIQCQTNLKLFETGRHRMACEMSVLSSDLRPVTDALLESLFR